MQAFCSLAEAYMIRLGRGFWRAILVINAPTQRKASEKGLGGDNGLWVAWCSWRSIHPEEMLVTDTSQEIRDELTAAQSLHHLLEARQLWLLIPPVLRLSIHICLRRHPLGQIVRAVLELRLG